MPWSSMSSPAAGRMPADVGDAEGDAVQAQRFLDVVAGGARELGNDRALLQQQGVEQGGLAHVHPAGDGHPQPLVERLAEAAGGEDMVQQGRGGGQAAPRAAGLEVLVLGELDAGLDLDRGAAAGRRAGRRPPCDSRPSRLSNSISAPAREFARIRSLTASACSRSILPLRKAR